MPKAKKDNKKKAKVIRKAQPKKQAAPKKKTAVKKPATKSNVSHPAVKNRAPVAKKAVPNRNSVSKMERKPVKGKKVVAKKSEAAATEKRDPVSELIERGSQRGFITEDEILHIIPDA